jgi:hypothetical protein
MDISPGQTSNANLHAHGQAARSKLIAICELDVMLPILTLL